MLCKASVELVLLTLTRQLLYRPAAADRGCSHLTTSPSQTAGLSPLLPLWTLVWHSFGWLDSELGRGMDVSFHWVGFFKPQDQPLHYLRYWMQGRHSQPRIAERKVLKGVLSLQVRDYKFSYNIKPLITQNHYKFSFLKEGNYSTNAQAWFNATSC